MRVIRLCLALCCLSIVGVASPTKAEWTQARGDATRSARVQDLQIMDEGQVSWRFFIGGSLAAHNHIIVPSLDDAVAPEIIMVAANRVVRKRIDDVLVWESKGFSVTRLVGLFDLDKDGVGELVALGRLASGDAAAFILSSVDGSLLWNSAPGDVGQLRDTARVVDMTGDGFLDLYLADAGTNLPGSIPYGVHLYTFTEGTPTGQKVWSMSKSPGRDYFVSLMDAVGDLDGDGGMEVFVQGLKKVYVYSGSDGTMKGSFASGNTAAGRSEVVLVDLDGDNDKEIVTFSPGGWALSINQVRVAVFDWDMNLNQPVLLWERAAADLEKDRIAFHTSSVANVDADPAQEVVVSFFEGDPGEWKTEVLDALNGTVKASIVGKRIDSTLDIDGDGIHELFFHEDGVDLEIAKVNEGAITVIANAGDRRVLKCLDRPGDAAKALTSLPCTRMNDGTGMLELIVGTYDEENQIKDLRALVISPEGVSETATFIPSPNVRFTAFDGLSSVHPTASWMGVLSSGRLLQFDEALSPLNYLPDAEQPLLGLKIPSYDPGFGDLARFPIAVDVDGDGAAEIGAVTSDSRAILADVKAATLAGHTLSVFSHDQATALIAGHGQDGSPRTVVIGSEVMTCLDATGTVIWNVDAFDPDAKVRRYGDVIAVDLDDDGSTEIVTQTRDYTNGAQHLLAWSIDDGTLRFSSLVDENNSGMRRLASGRIEGTNIPAKLLGGRPSTLWTFEGLTGAVESLHEGLKLGVHLVVVDVDQDGKSDVLAVNRESLELVNSSGELMWTKDTNLLKPNLGSVSLCGGEPHYVTASSRGTSLWRVRLSDGELVDEVTLAGGLLFASPEDAQDAGMVPSSLGNTLSFVREDGQEGVAVGAQDGTLTVVDPCDFSLLMSLQVNAPLREVVAADWDGDGFKEFVVSAADGYVYGIDRKEMDAPSSVIDTDPPRGITDTDVDDIETHSTLYASWSPVPDADSYHVGIFTIDGLALLEETIDVGSNTEGVFEGLTLQLGQRYIVSVRALGESGLSASTLSNGVTIVDVSDPEAECQTDSSQGVQGGEPFVLTYQASDVTAIEHATMRVEALGAEATETLFELEGIHQGQLEGEVEWAPPGDWPVGATMVRFEVMDGANHKATALVELTIDEAITPSPEPEPEADAGVEPDIDAGSAEDVGVETTPDIEPTGGVQTGSGCTCQSGTQPLDLSAFILLMLWFMLRRAKQSLEIGH